MTRAIVSKTFKKIRMKNTKNAGKHIFTIFFLVIGCALVITATDFDSQWLAGWFTIGWGLLRQHPETDKATMLKNPK
jgi:fatty acid desaturase